MYDIFIENVKYDGYKLQFGEKIKIEETEDLIIDSSSTSANDTTNDDVPSSVQSKGKRICLNIGQAICNQSAFNKIRRKHTCCRKLVQ